LDNAFGRGGILVVEDEFLIAMLLEDMLCELGFTVAGTATSKAEAFDLISSAKFDAAVLDVSIGDSDSFDIAARLRDRRIPFIFATGHCNASIAPELAGYSVLQKPYFLDELSRAFRSLAFTGSQPSSSGCA
jgi:CheY-like chemotaxis protein